MKFWSHCILRRTMLSALLFGGILAPGLMLEALAGSYELGLRMYEQGNYDLAARYFRDAAVRQARNPNIHYYLADSYVRLNRLAQAQAEYQQILAIAPDTQAARLSRLALTKLRGYLDIPETTHWGGNRTSEPMQAIDRYTGGGIGKEDYLDDVTENGRVVRWSLSKMPLRIFVEKAPQGIRNFQPAFLSQIPKGMEIWSTVLGHQLSYRLVDLPEQADIRVTWTNTIDTRGHNSDGGTSYTAGLTIPNIKDEELRYMDVKIATFDIKGKPQTTAIIYAVAIHELGHALGLLGHSENPADIMYAQNQHVTSLSNRDKSTIRKLYTELADINNLPPSERKTDPNRDDEISEKMDASIAKMEAEAKNNGTALTWLNLGVAYFQKGKALSRSAGNNTDKPEKNPETWYRKAMEATNKAIAEEPKDPRAYHKRSLIYQELGDYKNALADIQKAISFDRKEPEYYLLSSWYFAKLGQNAQSRSALDTYLRAKPGEATSADVVEIREQIARNAEKK